MPKPSPPSGGFQHHGGLPTVAIGGEFHGEIGIARQPQLGMARPVGLKQQAGGVTA
ncbi:hypothetical protein L0Z64_18950 (plasmid) [Phaeobacter sp. BS23]|uniref:hypothetical protein n=1 Tax=Phaeobacter sp. BS23 TaxID=2907239 RepID=UPI003869F4B0